MLNTNSKRENMKTKTQIVGMAVMLFVLVLFAQQVIGQESVQYFTFGVYAMEKPTDVFQAFRPILDDASKYLSKKLGSPIKLEMVIYKEYKDVSDLLVKGEIDFARFGPASYIFAKDANSAIKMVAKELTNGKETFPGFIVVRKDSNIKTLKDLKGKRFAFADSRSTIGRFLSQRQLILAGITRADLSNYEYLTRHDIAATAVLAGNFDAGAINEKNFMKYKDNGAGLRALVSFPCVTKNWAARSDIDPKILDTLTEYLLQLKYGTVLKAYGESVTGFVKGSDKDYDVMREALKYGLEFDPETGI